MPSFASALAGTSLALLLAACAETPRAASSTATPLDEQLVSRIFTADDNAWQRHLQFVRGVPLSERILDFHDCPWIDRLYDHCVGRVYYDAVSAAPARSAKRAYGSWELLPGRRPLHPGEKPVLRIRWEAPGPDMPSAAALVAVFEITEDGSLKRIDVRASDPGMTATKWAPIS